jgi:hypothetical protein
MYFTWKLVSVRLEIVLVLAQDRCTVCAERTMGREIFFSTPDITSDDIGQVEVISVYLEIVLISMQDRCTVYTECTTSIEIIGCEIALGTPEGTPR